MDMLNEKIECNLSSAITILCNNSDLNETEVALKKFFLEFGVTSFFTILRGNNISGFVITIPSIQKYDASLKEKIEVFLIGYFTCLNHFRKIENEL